MESDIFALHFPPATPEELRALIKTFRHRSMFLSQVKKRFASSAADVRLITKAYDWNADIFFNKFRESGESYLNGHLVPVATLGMIYWDVIDPTLIVSGLCHDSVEDIDWVTRVVLELEFNARSAFIVSGMTKPPVPTGLSKKSAEYCLLNVNNVESAGFEAVFIKCLWDRLHNMLTLWGPYEKREWKILETELYFIPLAKKHGLPTAELEMAVAEQKQKLLQMKIT